MRSKSLSLLTFRPIRWVCGFLLVWAALGGTADAAIRRRTPEIDPGSAAGGLTLLVVGTLLLAGKARRR